MIASDGLFGHATLDDVASVVLADPGRSATALVQLLEQRHRALSDDVAIIVARLGGQDRSFERFKREPSASGPGRLPSSALLAPWGPGHRGVASERLEKRDQVGALDGREDRRSVVARSTSSDGSRPTSPRSTSAG